MTAAFLSQTAPPELLVHILSYAATPLDVLSFALTCRHMLDAWKTHDTGLRTAWKLLMRDIPAAEQALIAYRASEVVLDAERGKALPPTDMNLHELSAKRRRPGPADLLAVRKLHLLAVALETRFCNSEYTVPEDVEGLESPEQPEHIGEWRLNMHKAIYRSIITGAALAGVYQKPFTEALAREDLRLKTKHEYPRHEHAEFLDSFPVLRFGMTVDEQDEAFGSYSQWLLGELCQDTEAKDSMEDRFASCYGRAMSCEARQHHEPEAGQEDRREACPVQLVAGGSHSDAHATALGLMQLFWACNHVAEMFYADRLRAVSTANADSTRQTCSLVVPWGRFSAWMVRFLRLTGHCVGSYGEPAFATEQPEGVGSAVDSSPWIMDRFSGMGDGDVDADDRYPPPVSAAFFVYFLRRHMKLAFHDEFFHPDEGAEIENNCLKFNESLAIFALDNVGERKAYYPEYAVMGCFPTNGFLDGGDLLVKSDKP